MKDLIVFGASGFGREVAVAFGRDARLRSRQLGQTVVSSSRRLLRLDNRPCSVCHASAETTGCVQYASYGCETKLPLARLSAPSAARRPHRSAAEDELPARSRQCDQQSAIAPWQFASR